MPQERFDWALIKTFLAVLDAGSFLAAARNTGAAQPTLSRQIETLEAQLQVPLFERTGRGINPTAAATAIATAARGMETGALALQRALETQRASASGQVRISTSQVAACYLLPPMLAALRAAEPDIQIELLVSDQIDNLLLREADIAVRMMRPTQASLIARKLGDIAIVPCAHRSYLRRHGTPRNPADLLTHSLIGYDRDESLIKGFERFGAQVRREHFALRTDDHIAYGRLVQAAAGIGFVARYNLAHWPGVVPLLPMLRIPPLPCWLVVHREIRGNRSVRQVFDFLSRELPVELARCTAQ